MKRWILIVLVTLFVGCGPAQSPPGTPQINDSPVDVAPAKEEQSQKPDRTYAYAGYPQSTTQESQCTVLTNIAYIACYSELRKAPLWVAYRLFKKDSVPELHKRQSRFKTDDRTNSRVTHDAYTHSGYDRGHMAPFAAIDRLYGPEAGEETFLMSNVVPQMPGLNRGVWRVQEKDEYEVTSEVEEVWVITGPYYDDDIEFMESGVEIPDGFYRVLLDELPDGSVRPGALVFDQEEAGPFPGKDVDLNVVEELTGLDFPDGLENPPQKMFSLVYEVAPNIGSISGGDIVSLRGTGLSQENVVSVSFGGIDVDFKIVDSETVSVTTPTVTQPGFVDVAMVIGDINFLLENAFTYTEDVD